MQNENLTKPNVSPLEIEIESKISLFYFLSIAAKSPDLSIGEVYRLILNGNPEPKLLRKQKPLNSK